jgi:hypothetical protein
MRTRDIKTQPKSDDRAPSFTPGFSVGTAKSRRPVDRGRKVLGIAYPSSVVIAAVAAAICLAPVAGAKDAESGQACTGPEMVATACHPSPESWPPPGVLPSACHPTGPGNAACGRRTAGLARRAATLGTGSPTNSVRRDSAGGARKW